MKKRIVSLLLALILTVSLLSVAALADGGLTADYSWYGDGSADSFTISTPAQLLAFANLANGDDGKTATNFKDKTVDLVADIDLGGIEWKPIAAFYGTFNGNGKTIKNFKLGTKTVLRKDGALDGESQDTELYGLFGYVNYGSIVQDLTVSNVTAIFDGGYACFGAVCADFRGIAKNVVASDISVNMAISSGRGRCGGMFGFIGWGSGENCIVRNLSMEVSGSNYLVGGFSGHVTFGGTGASCACKNLINCDVNGFKLNATGDGYIGGFIGYADHRWNHPGFYNCDISGLDMTVSGNSYVGGFISYVKAVCKVVTCTTQGKIDASGVTNPDRYVGGFMGHGNPEWQENPNVWHMLKGCTASVDIVSGGAIAGGMIGMTGGGLSHIVQMEDCTVTGNVSNPSGIAGGLIGQSHGSTTRASGDNNPITDPNAGRIYNCKTTGTVVGQVAGGLIGKVDTPNSENNDSKLEITGCSSESTVIGTDYAGGLVGQVDKLATTEGDDHKLELTIDSTTNASGALVVATGENGKADSTLNTEHTDKITNNVPTNAGASIVTLPENTTPTVENGVVKLPAGTTVTAPTGKQTVLEHGGEVQSGSGLIDYAHEAANDLAWLTPVLGALERGAFDDVQPSDWFYDDVTYASTYGLMTGTAANQFSPNAPVTRGMVMTILARREGIKTERYSPWYAAGCEWAKSVGISDGTNPEAPITREQLAVMLYRYAQYKGYDMSLLGELNFADASAVSNYAVSGLRWAVGAGLMSGTANNGLGKLLPQHTATRAQLAAILHRFFG